MSPSQAIPPYTYHRLLVGYHGCDQNLAEEVMFRGGLLKSSRNRYDWLGEGIYFWEHGFQRALQFAEEQKGRGKVKEPFVLGAYIHLGRCLDLTDIWATSELAWFHTKLVAGFHATGARIPKNRPAKSGDHDLLLRDLDCAVINYTIAQLEEEQGVENRIQTVRGVFVEGEPAYPGAKIHSKTHIQIAVRDPSCILGYFVPKLGYPSK